MAAPAPSDRAQAAPPPASLAGVAFEREVRPFDALDADGRPFDLPFLGGLDVPRPQFVDIDGDGDLDLFLQEYSDQLWYFENTGTPAAPRYEWRSDRYQDVEIGEWYRFVDLDGDGLHDLLAERPFSHIRHYRNAGTPGAPRLEFVDELRDGAGEPIFLDRQNIPALVDLDCDGRLDLFVGRVEGVVDRFEALEPNGVRFGFVTDFFEGIEIIGRIGEPVAPPAAGPSARPTMRHGANALAFGDFDGDGDQDLFWGDFFEPAVLLIENIGRTCSVPSFQVDPIVLPWAAEVATSGYNAPAPVDIDGDGDLDFLMGVIGGAFNPVGTTEDNFYFWERTAADAFELRTKRFLDGIDIGSDSAPTLADIDGDGDLDLVVGNRTDARAADGARLVIFLNEGTPDAPRFRRTETLQPVKGYNFAPALGDLDGDGDLDMLLGTWNQDILYLRNDGTPQAPRWVVDETMTIAPPRLSHGVPALGDIDGDGDLDLFIGQASGRIIFYRNTGTPTAPRFELESESIDDIRVGRRAAPTLVDLDGDGLLDLVVGREEGDVVAYRNAGTPAEPRFVEYPAFALALPPSAVPVFADVTGDGVPDLFVGTTSGGLRFYRGRRQPGVRGQVLLSDTPGLRPPARH
jgi:hypothetical protein